MNLDTVNGTSLVAGYNSTDWGNFSSAMNSNFLNAFTLRWTVSSRIQTALSGLTSSKKNALINGASDCSSGITNGDFMDVGVRIVDMNPGGATTGFDYMADVHLDIITCGTAITISWWLTVKLLN